MDKDLEILRKFSKEDLKLLILVIESRNSVFDKSIAENPHEHVEKIAKELLKPATNWSTDIGIVDILFLPLAIAKTVANVFRDDSYKGMLYNVCKKLKVEVQKENSVREMEKELLSKQEWDIKDKLSALTQKGKEEFFEGYKEFMKEHYGILIADIDQIEVRDFVKHFWIQTITFNPISRRGFGGLGAIARPIWWFPKVSLYGSIDIPATFFIAGRRREIENR